MLHMEKTICVSNPKISDWDDLFESVEEGEERE